MIPYRKKEVKNKCLIEVFHILIYQSGIFITDYWYLRQLW